MLLGDRSALLEGWRGAGDKAGSTAAAAAGVVSWDGVALGLRDA